MIQIWLRQKPETINGYGMYIGYCFNQLFVVIQLPATGGSTELGATGKSVSEEVILHQLCFLHGLYGELWTSGVFLSKKTLSVPEHGS